MFRQKGTYQKIKYLLISSPFAVFIVSVDSEVFLLQQLLFL